MRLRSGMLSFRGPAATPAPAGGPAPALNLAPANYYSSTYPFLDLIKISGTHWSPQTWQTPEDWLEDLPPGQSATIRIILELDPDFGYMPPGDYVITWSGPATVEMLPQTGKVIDCVTGANRSTFTVVAAEGGIYTDYLLELRASNGTGAPVDVNDIKVFLEEHEDLIDDGEIFAPEFLANIEAATCLRMMDWAETNNSTVVRTSQLPTESQRTWGLAVPYSVMGKLGAKTGKDLWICVPAGSDVLTYTCDVDTDTITTSDVYYNPANHGFVEDQAFAFYGGGEAVPAPLVYGTAYYAVNVTAQTFQIAATAGGDPIDLTSWTQAYGRLSGIHDRVALYEEIAQQVFDNYPTGKVYVEASNEVWNFGFDHYQFVRGVIAAGLTLAGEADRNSAYGHLCLEAWAGFEAVFPRNRVVRIFGAQTSWFDLMANGLEYLDPGLIDEGEPVKALVDQYAVAPYVSPTVGEFGQSVHDLMKAGAHAQNDAWWDGLFDTGIAVVADGMAATQASVASKRADIALTTYECGQHVFENVTGNPWQCTINSGDNTLLFAGDVSGWFTDGDFIYVYGTPPITAWVGYQERKYVRKVGTTKIRLYASAELAAADTGNDGTGADTLDAGAGTFNILNISRLRAVMARFVEYMDSDAGAAMYARYYEQCFAEFGVLLFQHYYDVGMFSKDQFVSYWGLKRHHSAPSNARVAWFNSLAGGA